MISPKLLVLLQNFSKNDRNSFDKYLQSPFYNENLDLKKLFKLIDLQLSKSNVDIKENRELDKKIVWKKIRESSPYQDVQMRRICSDLIKKTYHFIAYKQFKKKPLNELTYLFPVVNTPQLSKHFSGIIRQIDVLQQKSNLRNADYHYDNYEIEYNKFTNLENTNKKITTFENLENADFHLDCFYICKKLKNYCDVLAYKNMFALKPQIDLLPSFFESLPESKFLLQPEINSYYLISKMLLNTEDIIFYKQVKSTLEKNVEIFPQQELKTLYIYLINYCILTKINNGLSDFYTELFDLFKIVIEKEIMFTNNILDPQDYKNIITVGLHIKEFDWTENFIQNYTTRLPEESQDNDLNYNLAKIYFHKGEYEKVIEQLREVEYKNLSYALGGKLMLLKTYYELDELEPLSSLLDSYSIYLRRNKLISREFKQQYLNVLRFTRKLSSLAPYDKPGIQKLKTQINNCKALAAKKWLLEKVEAL